MIERSASVEGEFQRSIRGISRSLALHLFFLIFLNRSQVSDFHCALLHSSSSRVYWNLPPIFTTHSPPLSNPLLYHFSTCVQVLLQFLLIVVTMAAFDIQTHREGKRIHFLSSIVVVVIVVLAAAASSLGCDFTIRKVSPKMSCRHRVVLRSEEGTSPLFTFRNEPKISEHVPITWLIT